MEKAAQQQISPYSAAAKAEQYSTNALTLGQSVLDILPVNSKIVHRKEPALEMRAHAKKKEAIVTMLYRKDKDDSSNWPTFI